jgi:hypothetical protein
MPGNSTHWSTRLMAEKTGLSQTAIVRIWRAFGLQSHRVENFRFSKDPQFVEKVRDIVGLYLNPPDRAIVLCVDEKSQGQVLNRTQPTTCPGKPMTIRGDQASPERHEDEDDQIQEGQNVRIMDSSRAIHINAPDINYPSKRQRGGGLRRPGGVRRKPDGRHPHSRSSAGGGNDRYWWPALPARVKLGTSSSKRKA